MAFSFVLKHKITLFYSLSFVFICFIICCHSLSLIVIFCYSLSFAVTRCHTFSLVVIPCHSFYHSFSLIVTRCITRLSFYKRSRSCENCSYLSSCSFPQRWKFIQTWHWITHYFYNYFSKSIGGRLLIYFTCYVHPLSKIMPKNKQNISLEIFKTSVCFLSMTVQLGLANNHINWHINKGWFKKSEKGPFIVSFTKMWNICLLYNIKITIFPVRI